MTATSQEHSLQAVFTHTHSMFSKSRTPNIQLKSNIIYFVSFETAFDNASLLKHLYSYAMATSLSLSVHLFGPDWNTTASVSAVLADNADN